MSRSSGGSRIRAELYVLGGKHWDPFGRLWRSGDSCLTNTCCSVENNLVEISDLFDVQEVIDAKTAVIEAIEEAMNSMLSPVLDREAVNEMIAEVHRAEMIFRLTVGSVAVGEQPPPLDMLWPPSLI